MAEAEVKMSPFQRALFHLFTIHVLPKVGFYPKKEQIVHVPYLKKLFWDKLREIATLQANQIRASLSGHLETQSSFEIQSTVSFQHKGIFRIPAYEIRHEVKLTARNLSFNLFAYQVIESDDVVYFWQEWDSEAAIDAFHILSGSAKAEGVC
jgi:hypothetical protein